MKLFYKDEVHERQTNEMLEKFCLSSIKQDAECGVFAYIVGAVYKVPHLIECIDNEGSIDLDLLYEKIAVFSSSEKHMIRFALQCFNGSLDDIPLSNVMWSLDAKNTRVIKQAIDIRY